MSLFKIFKGKKEELDQVQEKHDGYAYYLTDTSNLIIDAKVGNGQSPESFTDQRRKVIGLSQKSKQFDLNFTSDTCIKTDAFFIDSQSNETYSYIITPLEESFDRYVECGIRASNISNGSMTFSCKEIPTEVIKISILRVEEDPYAKV